MIGELGGKVTLEKKENQGISLRMHVTCGVTRH
jgi:hypothetical protein